jgi:protein SCO1/2
MKTILFLGAAVMAGFLAGYVPEQQKEPVAVAAPEPAAKPVAPPAVKERPVSYKRSHASYRFPAIELTDQEGRPFLLEREFEDGRPLVVNFFFTSCSTICPVLTASMKDLHVRLGGAQSDVRLLSITIDPEYDTPEILDLYARAQKASSSWRFLTGDRHDIVRLLKSFDNYRGDKMSHTAVTFLRLSPDDQWLRLDGFASGSDLHAEYHALLAAGSG